MADALLLRARRIAADVIRPGAAGSISAKLIEDGQADNCTEVLTALAALREAQPQPPATKRDPIPGPLLVTETGFGILPQPDGSWMITRLEQGLSLGWMHVPELGGILLNIRDAHCRADGLATTLSRPGLQGLIADLQSIDAQLGEHATAAA